MNAKNALIIAVLFLAFGIVGTLDVQNEEIERMTYVDQYKATYQNSKQAVREMCSVYVCSDFNEVK